VGTIVTNGPATIKMGWLDAHRLGAVVFDGPAAGAVGDGLDAQKRLLLQRMAKPEYEEYRWKR
jgi:hypothetical protein